MMLVALTLVLFPYFARTVSGYAYFFASSSYCQVHLISGSTVMGSVVQDGNPRSIIVSRGLNELHSGSVYTPGEVLSIYLSPVDVQYAFEVIEGGAVFQGGECKDNRLANAQGQLVMPKSGNVVLIAGSASKFGGLTLTSSFTLLANASLNSSRITTAPNQQPPSYPAWHEMSHQTQLIVGLVVGVMGLSITVILLYCCAVQAEALAAHSHSLAKIPAVMGIALALASVGLVSVWATNHTSDVNFLGEPNWKTNLFAWHPVLMVGGFFVAQVIAISVWSFDTPPSLPPPAATAAQQPDYQISAPSPRIRLLHVFFQCAAVGTLVAGLLAIVQSVFKFGSPSLTSLHSWYGVAAVAMFGTNFVFGSVMGLLTVFRPHSVLHRAFNLLATHRVLGLTSLTLTTLAVGSGIMTRLPVGSCFYDMTGSSSVHTVQANPSLGYSHMKDSCKIANGLGITVALAAVATAVGVAMHAKKQTRDTVAAASRERAARAEVI